MFSPRLRFACWFVIAIYARSGRQAFAQPAACPPCSQSRNFSAQCRLITNPCDRASVAQIDQVLDRLFASGKPVVFHVHGRGREPGKTLRKDLIGVIERDYDVRVLMFNWDSGFPILFPLRRPVGHARESGAPLRDAITRLIAYRETHPASANIPVSLLVHSMGSIVLHSALDGLPLRTSNGPVFSNIVITGSDEDAAGHDEWVGQLQAQHAVVVTVNRGDSTLARARNGRRPEDQPLGRVLVPTLAPNATYLDLTSAVGGAHRYFEKGRQHRNVAVCRIFATLLRGEAPDFAPGQLVTSTGRVGVLVPLANTNAADECFRNTVDSPDDDDDG